MTEKKTVVIDNGSDMIKAGFAGEKDPCAIFPTELHTQNTVSQK